MGAGSTLRDSAMRGPDSGQPHLIVRALDRAYAIPTACIEEIVPMAELSVAPNGPSFVAGFLNLGGQLVTVVSLRRLLGMPDCEPELYTPLVILKPAPCRLALQIDSVARITAFADEDFVPISKGCLFNDCAAAVARLDGVHVVVLSPERLVLHEEQQRLAEFAEMARSRRADVEAQPV